MKVEIDDAVLEISELSYKNDNDQKCIQVYEIFRGSYELIDLQRVADSVKVLTMLLLQCSVNPTLRLTTAVVLTASVMAL
jgi:hypothetical protein